MKILFICSTEFQLFNALNLKIHLFPDVPSDIIIQFLKNDTVDFYRRVRETGLFKNVCYRVPKPFDLHDYAKKVRGGDFSSSLAEAVENSVRQLYTKMHSEADRSFIENIRKVVHGIESLDFSAYRELFVGGTNDIVVNVSRYIHAVNPACKINAYEEGIGDYTDSLTEKRIGIQFDGIYLYEPELALYNHSSFKQIPKIHKDDGEFIRFVNQVFDYSPHMKEIKHKVLFFDNYAEPMPAYLKYNHFLSKTLLRVSYKKHLYDEEIFAKQRQVYRILLDCASKCDIMVKLHPRTERCGAIEEYRHENVVVMENISIPWEVFCCNCEIENNIFVTLSSAAATAKSFIMEECGNNYLIILEEYTILDDGSHELYRDFYRKLKKEKMPNKLYLPKNEDEYMADLAEVLSMGKFDRGSM